MQRALFIIFMLATFSSAAAGYLTDPRKGVFIEQINIHPDGSITLWVDAQTINNPDACDKPRRIHIKASPGTASMASLVLQAKTENMRVGFYSTGCEPIPFWGQQLSSPIVTQIWIF